MGKYEVTQAQYEAVMTGNTETDSNGNVISATPSAWPNNPNRPVEKVSWDDIKVFLNRLNDQEAGNIPQGWAYVLPTEAQWEYACRAGTATTYSWGNNITPQLANYVGSGLNKTVEVGTYGANPWGFFDMHGNVSEWTADLYGAYPKSSVIDPRGPNDGSGRVRRGGSWFRPSADLRSAGRLGTNPSRRYGGSGFRVALKQVD